MFRKELKKINVGAGWSELRPLAGPGNRLK
jgi:hypothetical protein